MLFTQWPFPIFFAVVFAVHWALRRPAARHTWLLIASYTFYASWDWRFLLLIMASTAVDFIAGHRMSVVSDSDTRRRWLIMSLVANLGILGFFKYFNFFIDSAAALSLRMGYAWDAPTWRIILPVGISFFTFQSMSYTIDVYRRELKPARSLRDFAVFVAFFPQLVAGPIVRAAEFLPQLTRMQRLSAVDFRLCGTLFLSGLFKKSCIADHLALLVDPVFATPAEFNGTSICLAVLLYAMQIYCDFSGYSDMAIASAALLGFDLPNNFDGPYLASNIRDFWRRWHQTLSRWLKDYLYVPLGGNRQSFLKTQRNLLITMVLGGLWHGAGWNFVIWGALHGIGLITFQIWTRSTDIRLPTIISWATTMLWVCVTWIFFRSQDTHATLHLLRGFLTLHGPGTESLPPATAGVILGAWGIQWLNCRLRPMSQLHRCPDWLFAILFGAAAAVTLSFAQTQARPFIYFQF